MRSLLGCSLALVLACGGSPPNPETPAAPEASAAPAEAPAPAASAEPAPAAPVAPPVEAPPPGPARAAATLEGSLLGKPFKAVAACVAGMGKDPGKVYLEVYDVKDFDVKTSCAQLPPVPGARKIGMIISWSDGAKTDLASFKASKEPQLFVMASTPNPKRMDRKDAPKDWKPKGSVEVLRAAKKGSFGRIKLDVTVGKEKLVGEVDVDVMADTGS